MICMGVYFLTDIGKVLFLNRVRMLASVQNRVGLKEIEPTLLAITHIINLYFCTGPVSNIIIFCTNNM